MITALHSTLPSPTTMPNTISKALPIGYFSFCSCSKRRCYSFIQRQLWQSAFREGLAGVAVELHISISPSKITFSPPSTAATEGALRFDPRGHLDIVRALPREQCFNSGYPYISPTPLRHELLLRYPPRRALARRGMERGDGVIEFPEPSTSLTSSLGYHASLPLSWYQH